MKEETLRKIIALIKTDGVDSIPETGIRRIIEEIQINQDIFAVNCPYDRTFINLASPKPGYKLIKIIPARTSDRWDASAVTETACPSCRENFYVNWYFER